MVRETQERALARALAGPEGLTKAASTFSEREVIVALAQAHPAGLSAEELGARTRAFLAVWAIPVTGAEGHRPARHTTADMLRSEERLLEAAGAPAPQGGPRASASALAGVLAAREGMGVDQREALVALAQGEGAVRLLEAPAGSGKTYLLGALREAYERSGARVIGTAWQGQAARTLSDEAGIPAETAARLLGRLERERLALPPDCVLVMDEAGMMPTRPLERLLGHAARAQALVILVGDRRQLPALDAGGAFAALANRLGAAQLTENRRQQEALGRQVAAHLRAGEAREALCLLAEHGRLQTHADARDAREALVADWGRECLPHPERGLILAHDRADVAELNRLARERMAAAGLLGAVSIEAHGRAWAAGDRLVCRRNDYRPEFDVRNGTRGTVLAVDPWDGSLLLGTDEGRAVRLPADYLEHVRHGYALTGHVSQGTTVERTYLLASPARGGREWSYVAGSRHREELSVYLADHDPETAREALAAAWERAQEKRLALDVLPPDRTSATLAEAKAAELMAHVSAPSRPEVRRDVEPERGPRIKLGLQPSWWRRSGSRRAALEREGTDRPGRACRAPRDSQAARAPAYRAGRGPRAAGARRRPPEGKARSCLTASSAVASPASTATPYASVMAKFGPCPIRAAASRRETPARSRRDAWALRSVCHPIPFCHTPQSLMAWTRASRARR
jgi:hypothetical protein